MVSNLRNSHWNWIENHDVSSFRKYHLQVLWFLIWLYGKNGQGRFHLNFTLILLENRWFRVIIWYFHIFHELYHFFINNHILSYFLYIVIVFVLIINFLILFFVYIFLQNLNSLTWNWNFLSLTPKRLRWHIPLGFSLSTPIIIIRSCLLKLFINV